MSFFQDEGAEWVHVDLSIVAWTGEGLKTDFFIVANVFSPYARGFILLDILFGFDPYLQSAHFIISVD